MATEVVVNIPGVTKLIAFCGPVETRKALDAAAALVAGEVRKRWKKGLGANNQNMESMKPINPQWKKQKMMGGRPGKINYSYYGDFALSFIPRTDQDEGKTVVITFAGDSKGIQYISKERIYKVLKEGGGVSKMSRKIKALGNGSDKRVSNLEKARGLAYWRPASFKPDNSLKRVAVLAFNQSLKAITGI